MTPTQKLVDELHKHDGDWFVQIDKNEDTDAIERLYFIEKEQLNMLAKAYEVSIMDCTYKTNRYKMPLSIIVGHTELGTTFYAGFCFLSSEKQADFEWLLRIIQRIYLDLDLPNPNVFAIDRDIALINALGVILPEVPIMLCIWHVNNDFLKYNRKSFTKEDDQELWKEVQKDFLSVIYSATEEIYTQNWQSFQDKYSAKYDDMVSYVWNIWLYPWADKIVTCYTNHIQHFGTGTTSRGEGGHSVIKARLGHSTGDLKTVVDSIQITLMDQRKNYKYELAKARSRTAHEFRKPLYRKIIKDIAPKALWLIHEQRKMYLEYMEADKRLPNCTGSFNKTMGLPCRHDIKGIIEQSPAGAIELKDIHPHWHYKRAVKPTRSAAINNDDADDNAAAAKAEEDTLLAVTEPKVVKSKGRPRGSLNKAKRQNTFDKSTRRELSGFEHVEAAVNTARRGGQARGGGGDRGGGQIFMAPPASSAPPNLGGRQDVRGAARGATRGGQRLFLRGRRP